MDMLLSTGERVSCALCAMAINDLGHRAISLTGSQAGSSRTRRTRRRGSSTCAPTASSARSTRTRSCSSPASRASRPDRDVTTLGRGGSDTTAVALAAAVGAEVCEIYTDVPGVFSADPRIVPNARKLPVVSFEEMLEMAASGAGVLQLRSVEYARNHGVRIHCRSSFDEAPGTVVVSEGDTVEQPLITAVTHSLGRGPPHAHGRAGHAGRRRRVTTALAAANVNIDMIVRASPRPRACGRTCRSPCRATTSTPRARARPDRDRARHDARDRRVDGEGLDRRRGNEDPSGRRGQGVHDLGDNGINIEMISTSPIRISCVVPGDRVPDAVKALHTAFELSGEGTIRPEQPFGEFAA
jgi:aspartate kinase